MVHPGRLLVLAPRKTVFCLEHFLQASGQIHASLIKYRSGALTEVSEAPRRILKPCHASSGRVSKRGPPAPPRRVQPRRAVRGRAPAPETQEPLCCPTAVHERVDASMQSREETGWKVRGLRQNGVPKITSCELPKAIVQELRTALGHLRGRKRSSGNVGACTFGAGAWICVFCDAQQQAWRALQEMDVTPTKLLCPEPALVADMGCQEMSKQSAGVVRPVRPREGKIDEQRVVAIGPLRFVVDICDGEAKMMFLSTDIS
ncbi:hypothetical protein HYQ44_011122 [Verticillium longisporum]|nr:hypothetical protein HYQ44_011122 [Verticillium longisporum]